MSDKEQGEQGEDHVGGEEYSFSGIMLACVKEVACAFVIIGFGEEDERTNLTLTFPNS
jgi:hypothetical protein